MGIDIQALPDLDCDDTIVLFGARDPENARIAKKLDTLGVRYLFLKKNGKEVSPTANEAYDADPPDAGILAQYGRRVYVEGRCKGIPLREKDVVIDHHNEGDPGFDGKPHQFWESSSIGQFHIRFNVKPQAEDIAHAAMDHCYAAALRGDCSEAAKKLGVDNIVARVRKLRVEEIAKSHNVTTDKVDDVVNEFRDLLKGARSITLGNESVLDFSHNYLGAGYSLDYLAAQVAVAISGKGAVLCSSDARDPRLKFSIFGVKNPDTVRAFYGWAAERGFDVNSKNSKYGVPERLFGGAKHPEKKAPRGPTRLALD